MEIRQWGVAKRARVGGYLAAGKKDAELAQNEAATTGSWGGQTGFDGGTERCCQAGSKGGSCTEASTGRLNSSWDGQGLVRQESPYHPYPTQVFHPKCGGGRPGRPPVAPTLGQSIKYGGWGFSDASFGFKGPGGGFRDPPPLSPVTRWFHAPAPNHCQDKPFAMCASRKAKSRTSHRRKGGVKGMFPAGSISPIPPRPSSCVSANSRSPAPGPR